MMEKDALLPLEAVLEDNSCPRGGTATGSSVATGLMETVAH